MNREDTSRYQHSPAAYIYQSTNYTLPYGFNQPLLFNTADFNDNGIANFLQNSITCPKAGRVAVTLGVVISFPGLNLSTDDATFAFNTRRFSSSSTLITTTRMIQMNSVRLAYFAGSASTIFEVNAGDYITASATVFRNTEFFSSKGNFLSMYYIT